MNSYDATVKPVEILSSIPGLLNNEAIVVLCVRTDPEESFAVTDLALSKQQAERLRDDLTTILEVDQPIWR